MRYALQAVFLFLIATAASGQGTNLPLGNPAYHILDRLEIKTGIPAPYHSTLKYYTRGAATRYALRLDTAEIALSGLDEQDLQYIFLDNNEWLGQPPFATTLAGPRIPVYPDTGMTQVEASLADPRYVRREKPFLSIFYPTPANLIEVNERHFFLRANPILNFKIGSDPDDEQLLFLNQRGVALRGGIDDRIYFYTNILESQARFPNYVNQFIDQYQAIPGAGLIKDFQSSIFDIKRGYDYLNGQGYLGFNISRHVGMQFGYGRNFIGNGYRSMLLSDFSNNYLYLKLNWQVWKLHFQNIFAELAVNTPEVAGVNEVIDKKYIAAHHLNFNILPNLSVGLYEAVIFNRKNQFDLNYLNPLILYRTIEQALGSPDNVLLGFDVKWNLWRRYQLYGQIIFDEFKFDELIQERNGWWANKFGIQAGAKYIDAFGVDHLDLQVEYNTARPYTYTHSDSTASYSHYHQALAHPLGANFREWVAIARYQPLHRLVIEGRLLRASFGEDSDTTNWGGNILLPNTTREQNYENEIAQGIRANTLLFGLDISYQLAHNLFIDLHYFYRNKDSDAETLDLKTRYISGGFRWNIGRQRMDF